jgi:AraC-like DNA-binding protein
MKKALFLLWNKEKNISEIALELGYSNPSYFSKCFSEKYGFAPSKLAL